jgi:hypothetical protein
MKYDNLINFLTKKQANIEKKRIYNEVAIIP